MKEINLGKVIISRRKEKGLTQDELARFIGVSKASVSKWETGQSYPDITFLPQLAAYFDISIDELIGYEPQMTKENIRKLHRELAADFARKPFYGVVERCREIVKKYYSCYPLLFQIGVLLINNSMLIGDEVKSASIIREAKGLLERVRLNSEDASLAKQALNIEAYCCLVLGDPVGVMDLLDETTNPPTSSEALLASAYQMTGKIKEGKTVLQVGIFNYMGLLISLLTSYLPLCADEPEQFDETYKRIKAIAEAFDLEKLYPTVLMTTYLTLAQSFMSIGSTEKALEVLEDYAQLVTSDIYPLKLKGDKYFNLLDSWINELPLGSQLPRDEKIIKKSMVEGVINNPSFVSLAENSRYKRVVERLNNNCKGGHL